MKKINMKLIGIICIATLIVGGGYLILNRDKSLPNTHYLESTTPLEIEDSVKAAEIVKRNSVKVINKLSNGSTLIGTGFFHESGHLVTNSHVVDLKGEILVEYQDGSRTKASLISNDIISDIAILAVEDVRAKSLFYKSTVDLNITNEVFAAGYQYNLEGDLTITKGIVAAKRSSSGIEFIQVDLSINQGASGGPLFNSFGELLGIITLADENSSMAMAMSSDSLELVINKLINNKQVSYITEERPPNALSSVLKEVNYVTEDLYHQKQYLNSNQNENINDNGDSNSTANKPNGSSNNSNFPVNNSNSSSDNSTPTHRDDRNNESKGPVVDYSIVDYGRQLTLKRFEPVSTDVNTYFSSVGKDLTNCKLDVSSISHEGIVFHSGEVTLNCDQNNSVVDVYVDDNPPTNQSVPYKGPSSVSVPTITVGESGYNVASLDDIKGYWYLPGYADVCMRFSFEIDAIYWHMATIDHFTGSPSFNTGGAAVFSDFESLLTQTTSMWKQGDALRINDTYTVIRTPGTGIYNWNNAASGCPIK